MTIIQKIIDIPNMTSVEAIVLCSAVGVVLILLVLGSGFIPEVNDAVGEFAGVFIVASVLLFAAIFGIACGAIKTEYLYVQVPSSEQNNVCEMEESVLEDYDIIGTLGDGYFILRRK